MIVDETKTLRWMREKTRKDKIIINLSGEKVAAQIDVFLLPLLPSSRF